MSSSPRPPRALRRCAPRTRSCRSCTAYIERLRGGVRRAVRATNVPWRRRRRRASRRRARTSPRPTSTSTSSARAVAPHRARGVRREDRRAPRRSSAVLDPRARFEAAHAVDEHDRVGARRAGRRADAVPTSPSAHFDVDVGTGASATSSSDSSAAPYDGIPRVDGEPHVRSSRSTVRRCGRCGDAVAHRHPLGERGHVGDDADHAARRAERLDRAPRPSRACRRRGCRSPRRGRSRRAWRRPPAESSASWSASASASASDAWNVSPPERVRTDRVSSALRWSTTTNSSSLL